MHPNMDANFHGQAMIIDSHLDSTLDNCKPAMLVFGNNASMGNQTTAKKRYISVFSFPIELDMYHRLFESSQFELVYDLAAILTHRVSCVHYVSPINFWLEIFNAIGAHKFGSICATTKVRGVLSASNLYRNNVGCAAYY